VSLDGLSVFERGTLPRWVKVRQELNAIEVADVAEAVAAEFQKPEIAATITPGMRVALTAGSRGIDRIAEVIRATASEVRRLGAEPFVVPAMGSHGGATAAGQTALLAHYGVTEEGVGCPIKASMDTVLLGKVENDTPVYFDRTAYEQADAVIPIGRVKPHTDFHGPIESGLMKMIAIGLGKQKGAEHFHWRGFPEFHVLIPAVARFTISHVNIPFGIALVENGYGHLSLIEAVPGGRIWEREQELLKIARERLARLPGERIDVLFIDEIGKDISGDGADPNVVNRDISGQLSASEVVAKPDIQRIVVRDLTVDTEGNATGIGLADFGLRKAIDKIDPMSTYMNCVTAKSPSAARLPITVDSDRQAFFLSIASCLQTEVDQARIVRIKNTKDLEEFWASEPFLPEILATGRVELIGEPHEIPFDSVGMLAE
jgi:Lactate racemase N-terminal domain